MNASSPVDYDLDRFFDAQRLRPVHVLILVILTLTMLIDGYDILVVGVMLPLISKDWGVTPSALTGVFVAQQLGLLVGVALGGPIGDRFGRRPTLLACLTCFGLCTLLIPQTHSPPQLIGLRFVSALFFSGVLPNCVAYASEIAPKKYRAAFITVVFCGYTGGHFISAAVLAFVVGPFGWQGAFYVGGLLPLLLVPLIFLYLPESARFLASHGAPAQRVGELLRRFDPTLRLSGTERFVVADTGGAKLKARSPVAELFRGGLMRLTLLVWAAYFFAFVLNQLTLNWDTTILHNVAGLSLTHIAFMLTFRTAAGMIGTVTSGMLMDRFGASRTLSVFYFATAVFMAIVGFLDLGSVAALCVLTMVSFSLNSGLAGLNAIAAIIYPARARVTGVAWGSGMGRLGGMLGPVMGGLLLAGTPNITVIYVCAAVPGVLAALAILMMAWDGRPETAGTPVEAGR